MVHSSAALSTSRDGSEPIGGVEVIIAHLDASPDDVAASASVLSADERSRAERFAFDRDRSRYIVGRAGLRRLLGERLSVEPHEIALTYGAHGKPRLAPPFAGSGWRFNMAHADDVAVYSFARGRDVGIDVESIHAFGGLGDVARTVFSREEYRAFSGLSAAERVRGFFNGWTRKEAFVKALGAGLALALDRFDVTLAPGEPARLLRVDSTPGDRCHWALCSFDPAPGFAGAVVVQRAPGCEYSGSDVM